MRPQPEGCGERRVAPSWVWDARLQCGHSPKAVENKIGFVESLSRRSASMRPQPEGCGEPTQAASSGPSWRRFNAATARRLWRTRKSRKGLDTTCKLQCGHSPKAMENDRRPRRPRRQRRASMRPQPEGCGERLLASTIPLAAQRFNAATARRLWRT